MQTKEELKQQIEKELQKYKDGTAQVKEYIVSMKEISNWLTTKVQK